MFKVVLWIPEGIQDFVELVLVLGNAMKAEGLRVNVDLAIVSHESSVEQVLADGSDALLIVTDGQKSDKKIEFLLVMKFLFPKVSIETYSSDSWDARFPNTKRNIENDVKELRERVRKHLNEISVEKE